MQELSSWLYNETGEDHLELYDIINDPSENVNLRDTLPEQVEFMQNYLQTFVKHAGAELPAAEYSADDEVVYHRLRNLGYLE